MAQASVLTDSDIRRVFRIIETTRHAERNRLAFVLSIYAGMRIGEIVALTVGDVATTRGEARREIAAHLKSRTHCREDAPLIASQRNGRSFSNVSLSMLFKETYELAGIRTSSHSGRRTGPSSNRWTSFSANRTCP